MESSACMYLPAPELQSKRGAFAPAFIHADVNSTRLFYVKNIYQNKKTYKAWIFLLAFLAERFVKTHYLHLVLNVILLVWEEFFVIVVLHNQFLWIMELSLLRKRQTFSRGTVLHFNPSNFALVGRDFQEIIRAVKRLLRKVLMTLRVTPKKWKKMPRKWAHLTFTLIINTDVWKPKRWRFDTKSLIKCS